VRALIIDDEARDKIKTVVAYAEANRHTIERMKRLASGDATPAGKNESNVLKLDHGYKVVFSIEEQAMGWCRHLSVSVNTPGRYPNEQAVLMIMSEFGMGNRFEDCLKVWLEEEAEAVNVLTVME
jgi:hypothetical protein